MKVKVMVEFEVEVDDDAAEGRAESVVEAILDNLDNEDVTGEIMGTADPQWYRS